MHTRPKKNNCVFSVTGKFSAYNPSYFISFSQQAQSWNNCMPNISNAKKKKKNPGHLYLTFISKSKDWPARNRNIN
jgi:hypothetical protein